MVRLGKEREVLHFDQTKLRHWRVERPVRGVRPPVLGGGTWPVSSSSAWSTEEAMKLGVQRV